MSDLRDYLRKILEEKKRRLFGIVDSDYRKALETDSISALSKFMQDVDTLIGVYAGDTQEGKKAMKEEKPTVQTRGMRADRRERIMRALHAYPSGEPIDFKKLGDNAGVSTKSAVAFVTQNYRKWGAENGMSVVREDGSYVKKQMWPKKEVIDEVVAAKKNGTYDCHEIARKSGWSTNSIGGIASRFTRGSYDKDQA